MDYLDPSPEAQAKKYAFKCHRQTVDGVDHVWPVNALAFHPMSVLTSFAPSPRLTFVRCRHNTFASGGSDGTVSLWDHTAKKRLRQYPKYKEGIPSLAFSADGSKLAVAVSYCWDEGAKPAAGGDKTSIFIREVADEAKVRTSQPHRAASS